MRARAAYSTGRPPCSTRPARRAVALIGRSVAPFARTKAITLTVAETLEAGGHQVAVLNGDVPQNQRERTVERLRSGSVDILVATDVAARGLDVDRILNLLYGCWFQDDPAALQDADAEYLARLSQRRASDQAHRVGIFEHC